MLRVTLGVGFSTFGFFRYAKHLDKRMQKYHAFFCAATKRTNMNQNEPEKIARKCVSLRRENRKG